jgi:predicted acylesterase/phospholipase RssA
VSEMPGSVGLVLSGGGTRLFAHMGFLWALDDAGLLAPGQPVSAVVGNSAGSLVGAMLALGYAPREMWEMAYWRIWGYAPPPEPRAWRGDSRPRGLDVAVELDLEDLARALTRNLSYFKGIDAGLRFEALLRRILEREGPDGRPNPDFGGTRPPEAALPLYLIGFNLSNRRETIFQFVGHCPGGIPPSLGSYPAALGREASYEVCCDCDDAGTPPKELFRPWEGVRISTSLPLIFRPYYKPRFVATHWNQQGEPYRLTLGAYLSDGGSRDNYSLSAAIKLAGCEAVMGCFLGNPGYPYQEVGTGTAVDVIMRNVDGMMQAIFEADQDDAQIIARPVRTLVPHIQTRPGVTFDLSQIGAVMEAGYIAAAYYLRRLCPEIPDDRQFLFALVSGAIRVSWGDVFAAGEQTWGAAAMGRAAVCSPGRPAPPPQPASDYYIVQPPAEFEELATRFFAEQFPAPAAMAAPRLPWEEEIARRNRERREVAREELDQPPFRDMPLPGAQQAVVAWGDRLSWAAASGIIGALGSVLLAIWAVGAHLLRILPAPDPVDMWAAELIVLIVAIGAGWFLRRAAVRLLWQELQRLIRKSVGF